MPIWIEAGLWGLLGGSALVIGAGLAYLVKLPRRVTASIMGFGCGVLVSAVAYDLVLDGFEKAGFTPVAGGMLAGAAAYTTANLLVSRHGARHRKRSGEQQTGADEGGATAIAIGSLLDGIPESVVLGVGLLEGGGVSFALLAAVFLSNLPEGLSSAVGMRRAGRKPVYVFGLWIGIAVVSGLAALMGAAFMNGAPPVLLASVQAVAAGALLTMVADTMIPEAVAGEPGLTGMFMVSGLLTAFALSQSGG